MLLSDLSLSRFDMSFLMLCSGVAFCYQKIFIVANGYFDYKLAK